MRIGKLNHKGVIEKKIQTQDEMGGATETWVKHADLWCGIKPLNGKEKYVSHEKYSTATHDVTARFIDGVNPDMRLVVRGRIFTIVDALNIYEGDRVMQLVVEEEV